MSAGVSQMFPGSSLQISLQIFLSSTADVFLGLQLVPVIPRTFQMVALAVANVYAMILIDFPFLSASTLHAFLLKKAVLAVFNRDALCKGKTLSRN